MTARLLVIGFAPFGGQAVNVSAEAVRAIAGGVAATAVLPVVFGRATQRLLEVVEDVRPTAVVLLGQAGGAREVRLERVARNLVTAPEPDEAGVVAQGAPVVAGGPPAYASSLPVDRVLARLAAEGVPAVASDDAGGYVCNHVLYGLLHWIAVRTGAMTAGLVHVPDAAGMDRAMLVTGVEVVVDAVGA